MKCQDINATGSWRARQTIRTVSENLQTNGNCMAFAAEMEDWKEVRRLWLETNAEMRRLSKVFIAANSK